MESWHHSEPLKPHIQLNFSTGCCHSVTQSHLTLCDPTDCSTPGLPVHHHLLEISQTHVYQVSDAIQPSHALSYPSPSEVMSLDFNTLSRVVIAFLPRSKHLLIAWMQSPSAVIFSSVHFSCSVESNCLQPYGLQHARLPSPSPTLEACSNSFHEVGDANQPSHPLLPPSPSAFIFPTIRVFSNESVLWIRWPKYWSFSLSISPSNEHPGLIFTMDWLALLAVQGTLKSFLQHHSSKA